MEKNTAVKGREEKTGFFLPWFQKLKEKILPADREGLHRFSDRDLMNLIIPLFLEQLLVALVGLADTFMVSFAGAEAVSGVSLVNMLVTFFQYVFTALASGGAVIVSQYIGRGSDRDADQSAGQLLTLSVLVSAFFMVFMLAEQRLVLGLLFGRVDEGVMEAMLVYQRIMALSFIPLGIYNAGAAVCRSINRAGVTLRISAVSNIINVVGNAVGIFALHAGVAGVAWPSLIARCFSAAAVVWFCTRKDTAVRWRADQVLALDGGLQKKILSVAVPNSIESGIFQLIKVALTSIIALFGTSQIAANGIAQNLWMLSSLTIVSMGPAYITVIGQCMGAGETGEAEYYFRRLNTLAILFSVFWNIVIFAVTPPVMRLYPLSDEIRRIVIRMVLIHNIFSATIWPIGGVMPNGLRAAGDVRFTMFVVLGSTIFVRLTLSWFFGVTLGLGAVGITWAMVTDWVVRSVIFYFRLRQGKWKSMRLV